MFLYLVKFSVLLVVFNIILPKLQATEECDRDISICIYRKNSSVMLRNPSPSPIRQNYRITIKNNKSEELLGDITGVITSSSNFIKIRKTKFLETENNFMSFLLSLAESYTRANLSNNLCIVNSELRSNIGNCYDISEFSIIINNFTCAKKVTLHLGLDNKFFRYGKGSIILFIGTATSGKTTIIDFLKGLYPNLVDYSVDRYYDKCLGKLIRKFHPERYHRIDAEMDIKKAILSIFYNDSVDLTLLSLSHEDIIFLRDIYASPQRFSEEERIYLDKKFSKFYKKVCNQSYKGNSIITDYPLFFFKEMFWNLIAPMHFVNVFCPMNVLSERTKIRNFNAEKQGILSNKRGFEAFHQYGIYYRKKERFEDTTLETLKLETAERSFREHFPESAPEKMDLFLNKLGFTPFGPDTIEITYRFSLFLLLGETFTFIDTNSDAYFEKVDYLSELCSKLSLK